MIEATIDDSSSNKSRKLSNEEITGHVITFMLAGYDTTANALSYISYLLALNPHVQEKLQEEIDKFYHENKVSVASSPGLFLSYGEKNKGEEGLHERSYQVTDIAGQFEA
jgi:cytochrome P450